MRALILSHRSRDPVHRRKFRELAGLGWDVVLATPGGEAGTDGPLRLAPIPVRGNPDDQWSLRWSRRALRRLLSDTRPDLVHLEDEPGTQGALAAAKEAARLRIPVTVFSSESLPRQRSWQVSRRFQATMALVRGVIGGNRLAEALLRAAAPGVPSLVQPRTGVVPAAAPDRAAETALRIAFVGRLVPERGADRLLRTAGQLMGQWSLTMVGTGPEQEPLEELGARLGLASRTRWTGVLDRRAITLHWAGIDCLVVPSRATPEWVDEWSDVVVDAMTHEVAVVVSPEGALPEIVGDTGVVFKDDEDLLIQLQQLVADREAVTRLGTAARKRVLERFRDSALARELDGFFREVAARPVTRS